MLLAGDIGGTKTDLAVYSREAGPFAPLAETEVHSADYGSLTAFAKEFLRQVKVSVDGARKREEAAEPSAGFRLAHRAGAESPCCHACPRTRNRF